MPQQLNLLTSVVTGAKGTTRFRTVHFARRKVHRGRRRRRRRNTSTIVKFATISRTEDANTPAVAGRMCAKDATVHSPILSVPSVTEIGSSPSLHSLNLHAWEIGLRDHPDSKFATELINNIINGVDIGYEGEREHISSIHKNWPSAKTFLPEIVKSVKDDICKGRVFGPTLQPVLSSYVASPLGAFKKARSGKLRIIHDLSWPPGQSINDHISSDKFSMEFIKFDDITTGIQQCPKPVYISKIDIEQAFKNIPVRKEDWGLLGFTLDLPDHDDKLKTLYFAWKCLPFGLRSSVFLFDQFATGMEYIMKVRGVNNVLHYMDDYVTFENGFSACQNNLNIMLDVCQELGFTVQQSKVATPSTRVEVLGIIIDTEKNILQISKERLSEIKLELLKWKCKKHCKKRELLSLIGKLTFISKCIKSGRTFTRRLIDLSKRTKFLHHRIRLSMEARADIDWFISYMESYNGISYILNTAWFSNDDLQLWTDASDYGYGIYYAGNWIAESFSGPLAHAAEKPIAWRELYAIVVAVATFGSAFTKRRIKFHCDNQAIVYVLSSGASKDPQLMQLVRKLFYQTALYDCEISCTYINTKKNTIADALSRGNINTFRALAPKANLNMTVPAYVKL
jgi:hypothetical protein